MINKFAQDMLEDAPGTNTGGETTTRGGGGGGGGGSRTNPEVLKMQSATEAFANKVKSGNIPVNIPRNLIDNVTKISGQAKFADGAWGPITQSALQDIGNLAASLALLPERFGLAHMPYAKEDAAELNEALSHCQIEGNHITLAQEDQSKLATEITDHINKISGLYSTLLEKVQTVSNESMLKPDERKMIQTGRVVVTHAGRPLEVPLSALTSLSNYSQFCTANNLNDKDKTDILDLIMNSSRTA